MRQLLVYLKDYKKECILAPLFKMLEAVFELLVPLVMAAVIDTGIAQKDTAYIIQMCFVMVLLGGVGLICSVTAQYFSAKAACGFATKLRHALFSHIESLSKIIFYKAGPGGDFCADYKNDERRKSGAEWGKYGTQAVFAFSFYCTGRNGDGIYD